MKEIREILSAVAAMREGESAVLATVIDVRGSGYRLPGARMLIFAGSETLGTVAGGCLEADVLERAKKVAASGRPEIFTYDTTGNEESVFSMNMGCRGVIRILLERVERDGPLIAALRSAIEQRQDCFIATVISGGDIGYRWFHTAAGEDGPIDLNGIDIAAELRAFAASGAPAEVKEYEADGSATEIAFERISPPVAVFVFGAGADAIPLVRIAAELGWETKVHDHRTAYLTRERFPAAGELHLMVQGEPLGEVAVDELTAVVIMTHNYKRDLELLPAVLASNAFYIGALGPRRRTEQLLEEIGRRDQRPDDLYAPIGLDIGAQTPESIALSIAAEIQAALAGRQGGHLRDRDGSIYGRE